MWVFLQFHEGLYSSKGIKRPEQKNLLRSIKYCNLESFLDMSANYGSILNKSSNVKQEILSRLFTSSQNPPLEKNP